MVKNIEWILEKSSYDFSKDELQGLLLYLQKNCSKIVQGNKDMPAKFDSMLKKFISEQAKKSQNKDLQTASFVGMFE